jgi:hypothetical protein
MAGLIQKVQLMLDEATRAQLVAQMRAAGQQGMAGFKQGIDQSIPGIKSSTQGIGNEFKNMGTEGAKAAGGLSGAFGSLKGILAGFGITFGAMGIKNFIVDMFNLGSNVEETASKFRTTFGPATEAAGNFLAEFANKAGLSNQAGQDMLATIGAMTQGMGASQQASRPFSESILKLAGDFQSFHNVPIEETFGAIRSGLVGQYEPMRRFGVVLSQAEVNTRALVTTGKTHEDQLTALEKSQAALTLMYEKAGPALGDLDRTQDSTANTARRLSAEWTDMRTEMAEKMMPVFGDLLRMIDDNRAGITKLMGTIGDFIATGLGRLPPLLLNTSTELSVLAAGFDRFGHFVQMAFAQMLGAVADFAAGALEKVQWFLNAAAKALAFLGYEEDARKMREAAKDMEGTITSLETFARDKREDADQHNNQIQASFRAQAQATAEKVKEEAAAGGEAIKTETEKGVEGAKTSIQTIPGAVKSAITEISGEMRQFWTVDLPNQVDLSAVTQGNIIRDHLDGLDEYLLAQDKKKQDEILGRTKERMAEETQANRDAEQKQLQDELYHLEQYLARNMGTEEERRKAFERSSQIKQELDSLDARNAIAKATQRGEHERTETGKTETRQVDAYTKIRLKIDDVGSAINGVVGLLGLADTAVGGLINGFVSLASKAAGFVASIASGNWLGAIQTGIGLVGDLVGAIGGLFKTSKDPGRQQGNIAWEKAAMAGDDAALERLFAMSGRKSASEGWATDAAKNDAWIRYAAVINARTGVTPRDPGIQRHWGGVIGIGDSGAIPAGMEGMFALAPRAHRGMILDRGERPIIAEVGEIILPNHVLGSWETAASALSAMMAHRGALVGGGGSISHSFTLNGGVTIHGGGAGAPALADAFIREVDVRLGGQLGEHGARIGRSRL